MFKIYIKMFKTTLTNKYLARDLLHHYFYKNSLIN